MNERCSSFLTLFILIYVLRLSVFLHFFQRFVKLKLHLYDLLWMCCTTSCTTNPQQIE